MIKIPEHLQGFMSSKTLKKIDAVNELFQSNKSKTLLNWSPKQLEVLNDDSSQIVVSGGYGSGKTFIALYKFLSWLKKGDKAIITGFSLNTLRKLVLDSLESLQEEYTFTNMDSALKIRGAVVYLYGMDNIRSKARIRSLNLSYWYADEVTLQDKEACLEVMARLRRIDHPKWIWSTNPDSAHHWVLKFIKDNQLKHYQFSTFDNPYLPEDYIKNLGYSPDSPIYQRMVLGEWVESDESPFSHIQYKNADTFQYACIDPSLEGSDYTAVSFIHINSHQEVVIYGKVFKKGYLECLHSITELGKSLGVKSTIIESNIIGNSAYALLKKEYGIQPIFYRTTSNKQLRIQKLAPYIYNKNLFLDSKSDQEFINQVINWSVKTKNHDDAPDSISIFYEYYFGKK